MNKRVAAGALWFFAGWYLGAMISFHLGTSDALGPVLGFLFAAFIVADPRGLIWKRQVAEPVISPERMPAEPGLGDVLATH